MRTVVLLLLTMSLIHPTGDTQGGITSSDLTVLVRNTWSFSAQEIKNLNGQAADVFQKSLALTLKDVPDYAVEIMASGLTYGRLVEFRIVDLNDDGIAEILLSVDDSGRGLIRDISVLSRRSGKFYCQGISAYGGTIKLLRTEKPNLIIGSSPLFELTRADPILTFPMLYSWTGSQCKDVSRENRAYYEAQYLPALTNAISRFQAINMSDKKGESKRRLMVEVIGWALATEKLVSMFSDQLVSTNEVAKLNNLMETFTWDGEQDSVFVRKFRDAHSQLRGCLRELHQTSRSLPQRPPALCYSPWHCGSGAIK